MKPTVMVAALTLLAVLGGFPLVHAEVPEECRRQCALDSEACRNGCIDSRDFDGCCRLSHMMHLTVIAGDQHAIEGPPNDHV
jgi:hypothetical protein